MARFARDVVAKMHILTKELEIVLGPDTAVSSFLLPEQVGTDVDACQWLTLWTLLIFQDLNIRVSNC